MRGKRILREQISIEKMISIYCKAKHRMCDRLCDDCKSLLEYALERLQRCMFGEDKPVCAKCPVHCYRRIMRDRVIAVMRYSGPRMLYKHPVLAVLHLVDSFRNIRLHLKQ